MANDGALDLIYRGVLSLHFNQAEVVMLCQLADHFHVKSLLYSTDMRDSSGVARKKTCLALTFADLNVHRHQGFNGSCPFPMTIHTCAKFGPDRSSRLASFPHFLMCDPLNPLQITIGSREFNFLADFHSQINLPGCVNVGSDRSKGLRQDRW